MSEEKESNQGLSDQERKRIFNNLSERYRDTFEDLNAKKYKRGSFFDTWKESHKTNNDLINIEPYIRVQRSKYLLDDSEKSSLGEAINYLSNSGLTQDNLYSLFESWESNKTKGIKKFLVTITLLLTISFFGNININDIGLMGIDTNESVQIFLIPALFLIILMSFAYFEISRDNDKCVSLSKVNSIINEIRYCNNYVSLIDNLIDKTGCKDFIGLYKDFLIGEIKQPLKSKKTPLPTYHAFKLYSSNLEKPFLRNTFLNRVELRTIYFLGFVSLFTLIRSFLIELNSDLNPITFHFIAGVLILNLSLALDLRFDNDIPVEELDNQDEIGSLS